jgi:F-type H+-transporting ATPase subunit b
LRNFLGIALLAATFAFAQEPKGAEPKGPEPTGDATGHAQGPVVPSTSPQQGHAQQEAKHGEADAEGEAPMPNEIWWKWANFAVLAGGLGYLIGKNAGPFFRTRTAQIRQGIQDAARVRAEAEARAAEIESKISNLSGEIDNLKATSKAEIAAEGARVQAETQAQIAKIQAQAEMQIAAAAKNASLELKAYSAQLALALAETQIRERLDSRTQEDLANAFVSDLRQEGLAERVGRVQ